MTYEELDEVIEMNSEYAIHWLEDSIEKILTRDTDKIVISAGKTPSGHVHVGILRELIIGDALQRILKDRGNDVLFRIYFDSLDAAKRFPPYIDRNFAKKHAGKPFACIPNPFPDTEDPSYAEYFGNELFNALPKFGISIQAIWSHELYKTDEMQKQIRIGLAQADRVKKIVLEHITYKMDEEDKQERYEQYENWMPAMVICEKCGTTQKKLPNGTIKPNRVIEFTAGDDTVSYSCPNCGNEGSVKVSSGIVKLNWRLDWPAKWAMEPKNVFESSGKDHFTKMTGSWEVAKDLCKKIYDYEGPVGLGYEWVRLGDNDMGTSRGVVYMPKTYLKMAEPELFRMLVLRTNPGRHISFRIEEIGSLYDEFERLERIYYGLEDPENEEIKREIDFLYPLIRKDKVSETCPPQIPFKFLMIMAQLENLLSIEDICKKAQILQKTKGISAKIESEYMERRLMQTKEWIAYMKNLIEEEKDPKTKKKLKYKVTSFSVPDKITSKILDQLDGDQKKALGNLSDWLEETKEVTEENLKDNMMRIKSELGISSGKFFKAIYLILIGTKRGPRLGNFMPLLDIEWLRKRFSQV